MVDKLFDFTIPIVGFSHLVGHEFDVSLLRNVIDALIRMLIYII